MEEKQKENKLQYFTEDTQLIQIIKDLQSMSLEIYELIQNQPNIQSQQENQQNFERLDEKVNSRVISYFQEKQVAAVTTLKTPHLTEHKASAENLLKDNNNNFKYIIAFDTLDGVSNIEANIALGTIFGVYKVVPGQKLKQSFKSSKNLVMAGYILYTNTIYLTVAQSDVNVYAYDDDEKEFQLIKQGVKMPDRGKIYSINECYANNWYPNITEFIDEIKSEYQYDMRYTGTLVADFHRTLMYGGIYCYPTDKKQKTGKLKLVYECIPIAFIAEKAGGQAITNNVECPDILELKVDDINARSGLLVGSKFEVNFYKQIVERLQEEPQMGGSQLIAKQFTKDV